jgi:hypothetical protein
VAALLAITVALGWLFRPTDIGGLPFVSRPATDRALPGADFVLAVNTPVIVLPPEALVLRGSHVDPYITALESALGPFRRGEYTAAATAFERVNAAFSNRPHAFFYRGVSLLLAGEAASAVVPLERARLTATSDPMLADDAAWYLAAAFERSGRLPSAVATLGDLCAGSGPRQLDACRALPRFSPLPSSRRGEAGAASGDGDRVGGVLGGPHADSPGVRPAA